MVEIRAETPDDEDVIREVNRAAFDGGEEEVHLVDRLRAEGLVIASLVAVETGRVVGHILFSELPIETEGPEIRAVSLAPLAVTPDRQRQGIGSALVRAGLAACRDEGVEAVIVVGDPAYYPRFGFSSALAEGLEAPFSGAPFMALELVPGVLDGVTGRVRYPAAFGLNET